MDCVTFCGQVGRKGFKCSLREHKYIFRRLYLFVVICKTLEESALKADVILKLSVLKEIARRWLSSYQCTVVASLSRVCTSILAVRRVLRLAGVTVGRQIGIWVGGTGCVGG